MRPLRRCLPLLLTLASCRGEKATPAAAPGPLAVTDSLQGLSGPARDSLHHIGEGDEFIPVTWLKALNNVATGKPFLEDVERFGMLRDPSDSNGLPIGLSALKPSDVGHVSDKMVGFTCATCHTGTLTYKGTRLIIEGGPALIDAERFEQELVASMDALKSPKELLAFSSRVRAQGRSTDTTARKISVSDIGKLLKDFQLRFDFFRAIKNLLEMKERTDPGYGRIDAFGTGRDLLFPDSKLGLVAPVRYPSVWEAYRHKWLHWDANTNSVMERNIAQAISAGALFDRTTKHSTLLPENLYALEELVKRIQPPKWPAGLVGPIDAGLATEGRPIYQRECERCHAMRGVPERDTLIPYKDIGTDAQRALMSAIPLKGGGQYAIVSGELLREAKDSAFRQHGITPERGRLMEGERAKSLWRVTQAYASRPLTSVWATAPYLHNGSVPTLYDLLLPQSKRPATFVMGSHEFDPKKVGLVTDSSRTAPPFVYDTHKLGNSNAGHSYGTELAEPQRLRLLEYLKTL
jgi:hypothetical protein